MSHEFELVISVDHSDRMAELRLFDGWGSQLGYRQADFNAIPVSRLQGLFDLRNYLRHYVEPGREAASIAEIGVCVAEDVLGTEIFRTLWESDVQRTLRVRLPGPTEDQPPLPAALARVPWEIARPAADRPTLAERNLLVRVVHRADGPPLEWLDLGPDECLRVLFVFAEARGSRPLAARRERRELLQLFAREVYPQRRIAADFLTHGVTRERLEAQIQENNGYHIVHWSGHGHLNLLELAKPGGGRDLLSGNDLLGLFTRAGGFVPRLFFLSACHSGDILRLKDWNDFFALAQGKESDRGDASPSDSRDIPLVEQPGYTGTAHALLQGGVPSVIAMRYAVGDEYARDLSVEFYRALLAHKQPKTAAAALTLARKALLDPTRDDRARYAVGDHATPLLYGEERPGLTLRPGRSPSLDTRDPRLHRITELTTAGHEHFVGRTWELAGLGADFIGSGAGTEVKPLAVVTGLGGMGKTALIAEALALWESRFTWVLLYQAKPNALGFEATLRDVHTKLYAELGRYHDHVKAHPADAIYRTPDAEFTGQERLERLTRNLVRALRDEPILLVLDNFETNLKPQAEPGAADAEPAWACQDPAWDRCLAWLAAELVGTPSRVLVTCRRPLAALADVPCHHVLLGPLAPGEAALYLREHAGLRRMVFGGDGTEKALAVRLLNASRFHPLLMDRLARLATGGPALRPQLMQALDALEDSRDYTQLPTLFATTPGNPRELAYLNDALATSLDQLIRDVDPDARRLLWTIAVANEPVALGLLRRVWSGESHEQEQLRRIKTILDRLPELPPDAQARFKDIPAGIRAEIDALPPEAPVSNDPAPLLRHLVRLGLVTEERTGPNDANPDLTCHALVRERIREWMAGNPADRGNLTENSIRLAYADRLGAAFRGLRHQDMNTALEAGRRALVYCVEAGDYGRLASFASAVVTTGGDPRLFEQLLPHLESAATLAPEGRQRWSCLAYLADALIASGRVNASLPLFEQAATQARTAAEIGDAGSRQAWADYAWITGNWANALLLTGDLATARRRHVESAAAERKAGRPAIYIIGSELEALRIDIMQGLTAEAQPEVESRLAQVLAWWEQHRSGQRVSDAPDDEYLARTVLSALDVAKSVHFSREEWALALGRIDAILAIEQELERTPEEIAQDRANRAVVLSRLGRYGEAKAELETCLEVFGEDSERRATVLSSLSSLFSAQGDVAQAITLQRRALAIREQLSNPRSRASSHSNLVALLEKSGAQAARAEIPRHQLAALVYRMVSGLTQDLQVSLQHYAIDFVRAGAAGTAPSVPRVSELLADPAFRPLDAWLRQRSVDATALQTDVDRCLELARLIATQRGADAEDQAT